MGEVLDNTTEGYRSPGRCAADISPEAEGFGMSTSRLKVFGICRGLGFRGLGFRV